jgi:hypothetical protein
VGRQSASSWGESGSSECQQLEREVGRQSVSSWEEWVVRVPTVGGEYSGSAECQQLVGEWVVRVSAVRGRVGRQSASS